MDARTLLRSAEFRRLIAEQWRVSTTLCAGLFLLYYGFILLVGLHKPWLAQRIDGATTLGIPLAAGVIVGAWALTAIYVIWANRRYDGEVSRLRNLLRR
jgi:uncharacterized membrane protein (DUF485 family)